MKVLRPEEVTSFPEQKELSAEQLREVYELARAAFTAADLQRYTEIEEGISAADVLAELEALEKQNNPGME